MIFTVLIAFLPPMLLFKGLRHAFYGFHVACVSAVSWFSLPSLEYPLWHASYPYHIGLWHVVSITLITFIAYGWDKRQARRGGWRVPEKTLHALTFAGGTIGAYVGSKVFRHKTIKGSFRQMFWLVVGLQAIVLLVLFWFG